MQDIVFYAAANETLGMIRDYANERNSSAPVLTLGVSVCLRMRLFASTEGAAPYPISALNGISDWKWSMDSDFDRSTACKLVADANSISVHSVTDTVNGETMNFTEFVIPISNMNTEELAAWLGNEKMKSGLTGELVGYVSSGNAAFVLQIENFSVRNRVAGLGDPTALDQEIVTRTQAEMMIQSAVSASAATKQDNLTSTNAGTGISITSAGVISVANVPQSAITGLSASLAAKQDNITAGYRMALVSGSTVDQARYFAIEPAITAPANQTTTVVLSAGKAYEIHAVANNAKVLLTRENPVGGSRTFGLEGHAEIFVANTGCIQTGENVVLANALEPDAVNNCTLRFHDGKCIISVEDHIAGYVVVSATGTSAGTLPYALTSATQEYVAFDATLNGATIDLAGATTYAGEKHVVGNGYNETVLSGVITCTSKTTFSNLSMDGVIISSGTLTMGDVNIPNGATVAVISGGMIAVEKVSGEGVLNQATTIIPSNFKSEMYGITIAGSVDCYFNSVLTASAVHFTGEIKARQQATANVSSCQFDSVAYIAPVASNAVINFIGSNSILTRTTNDAIGVINITSGAVVDLTGNTNATPIAPGGGIVFEAGGATVLVGSGTASSSYMMDNVTLPAGAKLTNTAAIDLGGTNVNVSPGTTASANSVTFTSGSAGSDTSSRGGAFHTYGGTFALTNCTVSGNGANGVVGGGLAVFGGGSMHISNCTVSGNTGIGDIYVAGASSLLFINGGTYGKTVLNAGKMEIAGQNAIDTIVTSNNPGTVTISSGASINLTSSINPGGSITFEAGGATVLYSSGAVSGSYSMDNVMIPAGATLTNTSAVNLNSANVIISSGTTASASGCMFSSGHGDNGGAFYMTGGSLSLSSCVVTSNSVSQRGGGILLQNANCLLVDTVVTDNSTGLYGKDINIQGASASLILSGSTVGEIRSFDSGYTCLLSGYNRISRIEPHNSTPGGTVILASGAILDLTGNTNPTPIIPGGGITISSGGITIIDSGGTTHEFQRLAITGSTINSLGQILGATVYVPASSGSLGPWNIYTTLGSSTVSAGEQAQEIVIDGGLVSIEEL